MLALNEALQKAEIETKVRFSRVKYAPLGSISVLLTEKADATMLIPSRSNLLIRAAKSVDEAVVGVEVLEQWQRLKVHGMPLERYLGPGKMELLQREVESSTGILLKAIPHWLINEDRLKEQQDTGNKRGSAIVITVSNENLAKQLMASGLRFGGVVKKVEKFWEAGPGSVCLRCCGIGHERLEKCGDRPKKCVMCAGEHQVNEHQCGVAGCNKGKGRLCIHIIARCANCDGNHQANSARCPARHKAEILARNKKRIDTTQKKPGLSSADTSDSDIEAKLDSEVKRSAQEPEEENLDLVMETNGWAASPAPSLSMYEDDESPDSANQWD